MLVNTEGCRIGCLKVFSTTTTLTTFLTSTTNITFTTSSTNRFLPLKYPVKKAFIKFHVEQCGVGSGLVG